MLFIIHFIYEVRVFSVVLLEIYTDAGYTVHSRCWRLTLGMKHEADPWVWQPLEPWWCSEKPGTGMLHSANKKKIQTQKADDSHQGGCLSV